jgi:hypothetical protein
MNLTPANWKKSEVTENKQFVTVGMKLRAPGSEWCKVTEIEGDNIKVRFEDDNAGEFDEWYNLNDLQIGWAFTNKDKEYIELVKTH